VHSADELRVRRVVAEGVANLADQIREVLPAEQDGRM